MADSFKWMLELVDKVSGPAKKAQASTQGFEGELSKLEKQMAKIKADPGGFKSLQTARAEMARLRREASGQRGGGVLENIAEGVRSIKKMEGLRLLSEGFHLAYEAGEKVVDTIAEIGEKFIEATSKEERYRISFKALLGESSQDTLDYIDHISKVSELTDDELKNMTSRLLTVGFTASEVGQVLPASLDIAGFLGGGVEKAEAAAEALAHIKTTGEVSTRSIGALGLQYSQVMDQLKKETNLTEEEITKKLSTHRFAPQILHAVLQSIANKEGGELGTTAEKLGATIDARLKRLKNLPDQFFQGLVTSRGFSAFSDFVGKLAEELAPDSPFGQEVTQGLLEIGDAIADAFGVKGGSGVDTVKQLILKTVGAAKEMVPIMADIAKAAVTMAEAAMKVVHAYETVTGLGDKAAQDAVDRATGTVGRQDLGNGAHFTMDKKDREELLNRAGKGGFFHSLFSRDSTLNAEASAQLNKEGGIRSPFAPAIPSQAPNVAGNGGGKTINNAAKVEITVTHDGHADSDEIASKVASTLPGAVQQAHERMAVSTGAM